MPQIGLIAGTSEAIAIAAAFNHAQIPYLATVTTPAAAAAVYAQVRVGKLVSVAAFCQEAQIAAIVDASHPFAVQISQLAIAHSQTTGLPYLRFERPAAALLAGTESVADWPSLLALADLGRTLLTTGVNSPVAPSDPRFWLRILPRSRDPALAQGWPRERLILSDPNPPLPLELELLRQFDTIVTKASGRAGGQDRKQLAAQRLGKRCLVIQRPHLNYPQQTDQIGAVLSFCRVQLGLREPPTG